MKGGHHIRGFTIVEVMIVLAVTASILVSAIVAVQGKTAKTEFIDGIHQFQTQIQQTINDVSNGYYPYVNNFSCDGTTGSYNFGPISKGQGANQGCTFLGKALQFGMSGNPQAFTTFTLVGLQCQNGLSASGCVSPSSLIAAKPIALYHLSNPPTSSLPIGPNYAPQQTLRNGLSVQRTSGNSGMYYNALTGIPIQIGVVALVTTPNVISGNVTQKIVLYGVSSSLNSSPDTAATAINTYFTNPVAPANDVEICVASGTTNQSGLITIGGAGQQTTVSLTIHNDTTC